MPTPSEPSSDAPRRTILDDAKTIRDSFRGNAAEKFPAHPPRFPLFKALVLFWGYALAVYSGVVALFNALYQSYPLCAGIAAALAVFVAGNGSILCAFYAKKRFSALVEMLLSGAVRTGIPLAVALVFYFSVDKMTSKPAILTLAALYVLTLAFEVWVTLPGSSAGTGDGENLTQDERT